MPQIDGRDLFPNSVPSTREESSNTFPYGIGLARGQANEHLAGAIRTLKEKESGKKPLTKDDIDFLQELLKRGEKIKEAKVEEYQRAKEVLEKIKSLREQILSMDEQAHIAAEDTTMAGENSNRVDPEVYGRTLTDFGLIVGKERKNKAIFEREEDNRKGDNSILASLKALLDIVKKRKTRQSQTETGAAMAKTRELTDTRM